MKGNSHSRVFNYTNIRICHESDVDKDRKKRKEKGSILISNDVMKYGARQAMMDLIMHYARRRSRLGVIPLKPSAVENNLSCEGISRGGCKSARETVKLIERKIIREKDKSWIVASIDAVIAACSRDY